MRYSLFICLLLLLNTTSFALNQFVLKQEKGERPTFVLDYPENSYIVLESWVKKLHFQPSMAIIAVKHKPEEGRYILVVPAKTKQYIRISAPGYKSIDLQLSADMQAKSSQHYTLSSQEKNKSTGVGALEISSQPTQALIQIEGFPDFYKKSPYTLKNYPAGEYKIFLSKEGYTPIEKVIRIEANKKLQEKISLSPNLGGLVVQSKPSGVSVRINGKLQGTTPLVVPEMKESFFVLRLEQDGYYPVEEYLKIDKNGLNKSYTLNAELAKDQQGSILSIKDLLKPANSVQEYDQRIQWIKQVHVNYVQQKKDAIQKFETQFPKLSEQGMFEANEEFWARKNRWEKAKKNGLRNISLDWDKRILELAQVLDSIENSIVPLALKDVSLQLKKSELKIGKYDVKVTQTFPIFFSVDKEGFPPISFSGLLKMPVGVAKEFYFNDKGQVNIRFFNHTMQMIKNDTNQAVYPYIKNLDLEYNDEIYDLIGQWTIPPSIKNSIEFIKWTQFYFEKIVGEKEWKQANLIDKISHYKIFLKKFGQTKFAQLAKDRIKVLKQFQCANGRFIDKRDQTEYACSKIGNQVWMSEDLKYKGVNHTCYKNAYGQCDKNRILYSWRYAQESCPTGWHLPVSYEWDELADHILASEGGVKESDGDYKNVGKYLDKDKNDKYGFNGEKIGFCNPYLNCFQFGESVRWWEQDSNGGAAYRYITKLSEKLFRGKETPRYFYSLRCVQDPE